MWVLPSLEMRGVMPLPTLMYWHPVSRSVVMAYDSVLTCPHAPSERAIRAVRHAGKFPFEISGADLMVRHGNPLDCLKTPFPSEASNDFLCI
jgi:hypothetical protein